MHQQVLIYAWTGAYICMDGCLYRYICMNGCLYGMYGCLAVIYQVSAHYRLIHTIFNDLDSFADGLPLHISNGNRINAIKRAPTGTSCTSKIINQSINQSEWVLYIRSVLPVIDHQALVSALIAHLNRQTRGLLAYWYLQIAKFTPHMKLEYKPGSANVVYSRHPLQSSSEEQCKCFTDITRNHYHRR